jgi:CRISPR-associated exonuclease Cas4
VEHKVGQKPSIHADIQLCAQALCLEEMLDVAVPQGAIYTTATRRRHEVTFDAALRERTIAVINATRSMLERQELPPAPNDARCRHCSLINACLPDVLGQPARLRALQRSLFQADLFGEQAEAT